MRKCRSMMLAAGAVILVAASAVPERAYSQGAPGAAYCQGFARDYARRNSRGPVAGGALFGAVGGAIIGGIIGGPVGVAAAIGGGAGAVVGGGARANRYNAIYNQAFANCMSS